MSIADKINAILLLVTSIGVFAAYLQIRSSAKSQRATFLKDLYLQLRTDPEITKAFYLIEYNNFDYSKFHNSDIEPAVDRMLTLIDLVCEMRIQGSITRREMRFFEYTIKRIYQNNELQKYLTFLDSFYAANNISHIAFHSFQNYSKTHF